jgi:hypothetical protein
VPGPEHLTHPDHAQRPEIRPVVHPVRRESVVSAVPGQERDPPPGDLSHQRSFARWPERGLHRDLVRILQKGVETRTADDGDLGAVTGILDGNRRTGSSG